ncbi:hypothetical protein HZC31_03285 [Candidatus Woesearchaeota archaeon]|nr:hypothetical protein [Candidatus Woesearchaeota archaeon]
MVTYKEKADEKNRFKGTSGNKNLANAVSEKSTDFSARTIRNRGKRGGP